MGIKRLGWAAAKERRLSVETAELSRKDGYKFDIRLDSRDRRRLATDVGVSSLAKLRFTGEIKFSPPSDWLLDAKLGATAIQPCVLTLDPVRTRIESVVHRRFSPVSDIQAPGSCVPMPEDENLEPIPDEIDLRALIRESLVLELPLYPKRKGVDLESCRSWPETADEEIRKTERPFAVLSEFRKQLER